MVVAIVLVIVIVDIWMSRTDLPDLRRGYLRILWDLRVSVSYSIKCRSQEYPYPFYQNKW